MNGVCRLCGATAELQLSHIIPAFVFRWLKKDGPIRHAENIDLRVQDGSKMYLLCSPCEEALSEWETKFANKIFHPTNVDDLHVAHYGDWLLKFCVSVSWRALSYVKSQTRLDHLSPPQVEQVEKALDVWRRFILGEIPNPGKYEQHLLPFSALEDIGGFDFPPNINRYLVRTVEIDVGAGRSSAFIFSKLGRFGVFGFIDVALPKEWEGSKVRVKEGRIGPGTFSLPYSLAIYLADRARKSWTLMQKMSEAQQQKVDATILSNSERFLDSEIFKLTKEDIRLFGDKAFARKR